MSADVELRLTWRCEPCGAAGALVYTPAKGDSLTLSDRLDEAHALISTCTKLRMVVDDPAVVYPD